MDRCAPSVHRVHPQVDSGGDEMGWARTLVVATIGTTLALTGVATSGVHADPQPMVGSKVDTHLVQDCVDLVQYGARMGDVSLIAMWDKAGRDVPTLRRKCVLIGQSNPVLLARMSRRWQDVTKRIAADDARKRANQLRPAG